MGPEGRRPWSLPVMFPGFRVAETLHDGRNAVVYRGERVSDGRTVILKLLAEEYPYVDAFSKLRSFGIWPATLRPSLPKSRPICARS